MIKLFISQPMRNKTDEEIKEERKEIISACKNKYGDIDVIDSFFESAPHEAKPLWFLGKSFELLSAADVAVFAKGWREARGCKLENEACKKYGIEIVEMS